MKKLNEKFEIYMKRFAISSTTFDTLKEAKAKLREWKKEGHLDEDAKIYESSTIYIPNIKVGLKKLVRKI